MRIISRRQILQAGAATMALSGLGFAGENRKALGIQLYTLRDEMAKSVSGTLQHLAQIGYSEVEFAGYFDHDAKQIHGLLDEKGLTAPSSHVPLSLMQSEAEKTIEFAVAVGHLYLVVPWLPEEQRQSIDQYRRLAATLNSIGEQCKAAGIKFAYHNHDFEFIEIDGQIPFDLLLKETDENLVQIELDLYWINKAGKDPIEYFKNFPGRFPLWHVKDMDNTEEKFFTEVGNGVIDWKKIFKNKDLSGMKYLFVEQDRFKNNRPFESVEISYKYLKNLEY